MKTAKFVTRLLGGAALATTLASCGPGRGASGWIPDDAAFVHCLVGGSDYRVRQIIREVPLPSIPTGLLAREFDPFSVAELGYARDEAVCVSLHVPPESDVDGLTDRMQAASRAYFETGNAVRQADRACACDVARELKVRHLVPKCLTIAANPACEVTEDDHKAFNEKIAPLYAAMDAINIPLEHWRLSGSLSASGWFLRHRQDLLARHPGGITVFQQGAEVPAGVGQPIVEALLAVEGVVAVLRQDSGTAYSVIRELDGDYIIDYMQTPRVNPRWSGLIRGLAERRPSVFVDALARPETPRVLHFDRADGELVELDHTGLDRFDRFVIGRQAIRGVYDPTLEERVEPPLYVDRVSLLAPYGGDGRKLELSLRLNEAGRQWAGKLEDKPLEPTMAGFGLGTPEPFAFRPAFGRAGEFLFRGQPSTRVWFFGLNYLPSVAAAMEVEHPKTTSGTPRKFEMDVPTGRVLADWETVEGTKNLRNRFVIQPNDLRARVRADHSRIDAYIGP